MKEKLERDELSKCTFHEFKAFEELDPKVIKTKKYKDVKLYYYLDEHYGWFNDNLYAVVKAYIFGKPCYITIKNEHNLFSIDAEYHINEPSLAKANIFFNDKLPEPIRQKFPFLSSMNSPYKGLENYAFLDNGAGLFFSTATHNNCPLKEEKLYTEQCDLILKYLMHVCFIEREYNRFRNTKIYAILHKQYLLERKKQREAAKKNENKMTAVRMGLLAWRIYRLANGIGGNDGTDSAIGADVNLDLSSLDLSQASLTGIDNNPNFADFLTTPADSQFIATLDNTDFNTDNINNVALSPEQFQQQPAFCGHATSYKDDFMFQSLFGNSPTVDQPFSSVDFSNGGNNITSDFAAAPFENSKADIEKFSNCCSIQDDAVSKYKDAMKSGNLSEASKWESIAIDAEYGKQASNKFYTTFGLDAKTLAGLKD